MPRQLLLMRHAKSSHDDLSLDDHSRPLNKRGKKAAAVMANYLQQEQLKPDLTLCSSAERTRRTLDPILDIWPKMPVKYEDALYLASVGDTLDLLHSLAAADRVLVLGHNPTTEQVAQVLSDPFDVPNPKAMADLKAKFPTGALAILGVNVEAWRDLDRGCAHLLDFVKPRDLSVD